MLASALVLAVWPVDSIAHLQLASLIVLNLVYVLTDSCMSSLRKVNKLSYRGLHMSLCIVYVYIVYQTVVVVERYDYIFTDRINAAGYAIAFVRPSVRPFVCPFVSTLYSETTGH